MKKTKKMLLGTVLLATALGGTILAVKEKPQETTRTKISLERTVSWDNPQETLNVAYQLAKPKHISEVIYDPEFIHSDNYIRQKLSGHYSEKIITNYLNNSRSQSPSHNLCIPGILLYTGDGKKRPSFARKSALTSPGLSSIEDVRNAIEHEDAHAKEERFGYDFGDSIMGGPELIQLFNSGEIKPQVILEIGELGAYAHQIESGEKSERKPSIMCTLNAKTNLYTIVDIVEKRLEKNMLTQMERKYAESTIRKHKQTIERIKKL
jgi:hypothetical protein